jgi:hypothetical protein
MIGWKKNDNKFSNILPHHWIKKNENQYVLQDQHPTLLKLTKLHTWKHAHNFFLGLFWNYIPIVQTFFFNLNFEKKIRNIYKLRKTQHQYPSFGHKGGEISQNTGKNTLNFN